MATSGSSSQPATRSPRRDERRALNESAGGATASATGSFCFLATASKRVSGWKASDTKPEFREVVCAGSFCKHWDKLGIVKEEGDRVLVLIAELQNN